MAQVWSFLASAIGVLSLLTPLAAEETVEETNPVGLSIDLISELEVIAPGKPFTVGLHLQHQKGYHTYWKNPGIVGMATTLTWDLPKGFTASDIQWPYPEQSLMAGHPCHGYERDVTLLITITPPKVITDKAVTLKTSAQWMCCAQNCHPGFQDFSITLPVGEQAKPTVKGKKLIATAKEEIPKPLKATDFTVSLTSAPDEKNIQFVISPPPPQQVYFFSSDGQVSSDPPQELIKDDNRSLRLTVPRSTYSPEGKTSLPGILKLGKSHFLINPAYPSKTAQ